MRNPGENYGLFDRVIHRLAFASNSFQRVLMELESSMYRSDIAAVTLKKPIFIAGLPRAGTTTLLNTLCHTEAFATFTYRDMPMAYAPLLWNKLTGGFQGAGERQVRAHGDGILVDEDSPEGFEEILWKLHWPQKYKSDHIELWMPDDHNAEFVQKFKELACKLISVRTTVDNKQLRYLSKNNTSVSRLHFLLEHFPEASVVVPYRNPAQHAASLYKQHIRFTEMQVRDRFILRYMNDIGHHDFGLGLKFIAFPGFNLSQDAGEPTCWEDYWAAAYSFVLDKLDARIILFDYDEACESNSSITAALLETLELPQSGLAMGGAGFRAPERHNILPAASSESIAVWEELRASEFNVRNNK